VRYELWVELTESERIKLFQRASTPVCAVTVDQVFL